MFGHVVVSRAAPNGRVDSASTPDRVQPAAVRRLVGGAPGRLPEPAPGVARARSGRRLGPARRPGRPPPLEGREPAAPPRSKLVRLAQYADAVAVTRFLAPNWRLNSLGVGFHLRNIAEASARNWHVPEITSTSTAGATATIEALLSGTRAHVDLRRRAGRWQVTRSGPARSTCPWASWAGPRRPARRGCRIPAGSTAALAAAQRGREGVGPLAVVPGPVVATDRVVVGDRAAERR